MNYEEFLKVEKLREIETGKVGKVCFIYCGEDLEMSEIHVKTDSEEWLSIFPEDFEYV